jgi:hypothetical protein
VSDQSDSRSESRRRHYQRNRLRRGLQLRLAAAKRRAAELDLPFCLVEEDIATPEVCPICGVALVMRVGKGGGKASPSMDRIVPSLGYMKDNIVIICRGCNTKKQDSTAEELAAMAEWIYRMREERGLC